MTLGERIDEARKIVGANARRIREAQGRDETSVARRIWPNARKDKRIRRLRAIEDGTGPLMLSRIVELAGILGVPIRALVGNE